VLEVAETASGLAQVLDALGAGPYILVGHSMGTQWVVELAAQRPDLVQALVLIGPVTDRRRRSMPLQALALSRDTVGETPGVNQRVFTDYLRAGPSWYLRQVRRMIDYPIEDRLAEVAAPVLVLRGGNDPIARADWSRLLRDRAARGSMAVVPGHRHVVQHTAPRAVASAIRAFVHGAG
jgi:pimeloyl-ACP methyl ester carboxylesterase